MVHGSWFLISVARFKMEGPDPGFKVDERSLGEFLLSRLKSHPQNDVIQINAETGEEQTVAELLLRSIELAAGLEARGIAQGDVVMLMGNYSPNLFSVVLAAAYQNAILFPVDPNLTDREAVSYFTTLCQPKIVFCDSEVAHRLKTALNQIESSAEVVILDSNSEPADERIRKFEDIVIRNSSKSYKLQPVKDPKNEIVLIIGSSGTTGKPKGIMLTHRCFVYACQIWEGVVPASQKLRNLQATLISWITGYTILLTSCALGFPRVFAKDFSPESLIKAIHLYKPQWAFMLPKDLRDISNLPDFKDYDLSSFKDISVGGSPLDAKTRSLIYDTWPKGVVLNQSYGCSEIGGFITEPFGGAPPESAGLLIRGTQCKVSDTATGQKLQFNQVGKFSFRCEHTMMKGYLNNPEATAKAIDSEGFYSPGDIGYITEKGFLYITGRISDLMLVFSQLVSPIELENSIGTIDGVLDVVVIGKPHELNNDQPLAVVVKKPGSGVTAEQIISHVEENFSGFKRLYGGVQFVDHIPRNSNGKIIRKQVSQMLGF